MSNKMECFGYKGGCGIRECMCIKRFKRRVGLGYWINGFGLLIIQMLLKRVKPLRI